MTPERKALLLKYRTTTPEGYPTFDLERYYNDMTTEDIVILKNLTDEGLKKHPDFGTVFYTEFSKYLNKKLEERK